MKIIDLLNKIANGEEVPKKIEYRNIKFVYDKGNRLYIVENYNEYNDLLMELSNHKGTDLNYEVEILEEEKKIPEKLYKYMEKEEEGCYENILRVYDGGEYEINEDMSFVIDKINSIIDYLKSKGDE